MKTAANEPKPAFRLAQGRALRETDVDSPVLEYLHPDGSLAWSIVIGDIVLMAEYTTDEGPEDDDYFLVFVTVENDTRYFSTASFYSEGHSDMINALADRWSSNIQFRLVSSTDWDSQVIWPPQLAGHEYLQIKEVPSHSLADRLKKAVLGPEFEYSPSDLILAYLDEVVERSE